MSNAISPLAARILRTLFELARADRESDLRELSRQLGTSCTEVAGCLVVMERVGLVRAERIRLTMAGLVVATRLPALQLAACATRASAVEAATAPVRRPAMRKQRARRPQRLPAGWAAAPAMT